MATFHRVSCCYACQAVGSGVRYPAGWIRIGFVDPNELLLCQACTSLWHEQLELEDGFLDALEWARPRRQAIMDAMPATAEPVMNLVGKLKRGFRSASS